MLLIVYTVGLHVFNLPVLHDVGRCTCTQRRSAAELPGSKHGISAYDRT